jgi:hypothetical protein
MPITYSPPLPPCIYPLLPPTYFCASMIFLAFLLSVLILDYIVLAALLNILFWVLLCAPLVLQKGSTALAIAKRYSRRSEVIALLEPRTRTRTRTGPRCALQ